MDTLLVSGRMVPVVVVGVPVSLGPAVVVEALPLSVMTRRLVMVTRRIVMVAMRMIMVTRRLVMVRLMVIIMLRLVIVPVSPIVPMLAFFSRIPFTSSLTVLLVVLVDASVVPAVRVQVCFSI